MAPIKFEEDMKAKLEKRTIQPSAKSWDTLSKRLDNDTKKNNKKGFWWLGIAASIIGVLLVSNFFLNSETINTENNIVEENIIIDTLKTETPKQDEIVENETIKDIKNTKSVIKKPLKNATKVEKTTIVNSEIKKPLIIEKSNVKNEAFIALPKIETEAILADKNTVTDKEIETLLINAKNAIIKKNKTTIPVDYNGLLIAVDDELDETFREKMLKVVKKGYETVRVSVAERNE